MNNNKIREEEVRNEYQRYIRDHSQRQREEQMRQIQEQIYEHLQQTVSGGPSSLRIIAKISGSSYDITVTKQEELDMVQMLINKFINTFEHQRPHKLF